MNTYHRVRQFTYTSKPQQMTEHDMNPIQLLVPSKMADRLHEADNARLRRLASQYKPRAAPVDRPAKRLSGEVAKRPAYRRALGAGTRLEMTMSLKTHPPSASTDAGRNL